MEEKTTKVFARYALPQMIGLLANSVYVIVDGIFIGNRLGTKAMAAAAVSVPLVEFLIAISMAMTSGAGVLISSSFGRNDKKRAREIFNLILYMALAVGLLIIGFGNLYINQLANLLGSTKEIHTLAITYMRYIITFSPFLIFSFLLGGLVRNDGENRLAMIAMSLGSFSNIVLDYVFMYPFNMGIGGAALATAIGPIFSVLILLPHFFSKKGNLFFERVKIKIKEIKEILRLGFPAFIMEFSIGTITFIYNFAIIKVGYGEMGLAAYLIIGYLMLIILAIFLGMAEGLQPAFSYFNGTKEVEKNKNLRKFSVKVFIAIGIIGYIFIYFFAKNFFSIFNPNDLKLLDFVNKISKYYFIAFFLAGYNILMISFWQSNECTRIAVLISALRSIVVPIVLMMTLTLVFSREIIWIVHSLSETITAIIGILILKYLKRNIEVFQKI